MKKADEIAGAPVIAGCKLLGSGSNAQLLGGGLAGGLGRRAGEALSQAPTGGPLAPREIGYLALTADMLLLMTVKAGMAVHHATGIRASAGRDSVVSVEIGGSMLMNPMTIRFDEGTVWHFEVDKANKRKAKELIAELGLGPPAT